ncbi:hypothetical protein NDU88_004722 [Pleurodeles waltl]|uniref:Uncharacterized protein n=1 Tax=Pleurodeles waltl TaxID=8319 RepID=A0AAV7VJ17_PLEWA|nr:hypothetical protein NDU88_004722 [Pleurodeles waltl]
MFAIRMGTGAKIVKEPVPDWYAYMAATYLYWTIELLEDTIYVGKEECVLSTEHRKRGYFKCQLQNYTSIAVAPDSTPKI